MASLTPAERAGVARKVGSLDKGKLADVLVVAGDVAKNISLLEDRANLLAVLQGGVVKAGHLAPRDECAGLPGAAAFRNALARAVHRRDADAMTALSAQDIVLGFGGESGPRELGKLLGGRRIGIRPGSSKTLLQLSRG